MRGVAQTGNQGLWNANQVPYNIVPVFATVFIPYVNILLQNAIFKASLDGIYDSRSIFINYQK